jgi:hypothetical protein
MFLKLNKDPDDFDVVGRVKLFQNILRVGHLRHCLRRDERYGIDVLESHADQCLQIISLQFGRNYAGQPLPGIAWTFNQFDQISSWHLAINSAKRNQPKIN